jgi:XRE family transcriptional regulator, regulator of sulfur utilization
MYFYYSVYYYSIYIFIVRGDFLENNKLKGRIGQAIRLERQNMKMTQFDLGEEADVHYNYIGQIERGEKDITVHTLMKICNVFGMSMADFFERIHL